MKIGERIKMKRVEKEWTQEHLAKLLQVSRSTVSGWEVGRNYPDLDMIVRISDLFDVPLDQLLREDHKMTETISQRAKYEKHYKLLAMALLVLLVLGFGWTHYLENQSSQYVSNLTDHGWSRNEENLGIYEQVEKDIQYSSYVTSVYFAGLFKLNNQFTISAEMNGLEIQRDDNGELQVKIPKDYLATDGDYLVAVDEAGRLVPITNQMSPKIAKLIEDYVGENQETYRMLIKGLLEREAILMDV